MNVTARYMYILLLLLLRWPRQILHGGFRQDFLSPGPPGGLSYVFSGEPALFRLGRKVRGVNRTYFRRSLAHFPDCICRSMYIATFRVSRSSALQRVSLTPDAVASNVALDEKDAREHDFSTLFFPGLRAYVLLLSPPPLEICGDLCSLWLDRLNISSGRGNHAGGGA